MTREVPQAEGRVTTLAEWEVLSVEAHRRRLPLVWHRVVDGTRICALAPLKLTRL